MISTVVLIFSISWAQDLKEISFRDKVHISTSGYQTDRSPAPTEYNCKAYSNPGSAGLKAKLKSGEGFVYGIECKATEVGDEINLVVFKKDKELTRLSNVASASGDCGYNAETQAWLVDLNGDSSMDVITRTKTKNVPSDCGDKGKAKEEDFATAYFWDKENQHYSKAKLDERDLKKFKKKYDFSWRAY